MKSWNQFRQKQGAARHQAITQIHIDLVLCRNMDSLGDSKFNIGTSCVFYFKNKYL